MNKQYYPAKELAGLPGMPKTESAVIRKAKRDGWSSRDRSGRGGGREYALSSLPAETRAYLARQHVNDRRESTRSIPAVPDSLPSPADRKANRLAARAQSLATFDRLPEWQQRGGKAKLAIIRAFEDFLPVTGLVKTEGLKVFAYEYNMGRIQIGESVRSEIPNFSDATLDRWIRDEHELGAMGLVDMYGNRKGQSKIETYVTGTDKEGRPIKPYVTALLTIMVEEPHVEPKKAHEYMLSVCKGGPSVGVKSVDRWMKAWIQDHPFEWAHIVNPDKAKGAFRISFGDAAEGISGPNQRWEIDATPADLLLTDGRHKIIGIIDVGVRRLKLQVSRTERAVDGIATVRRALLDWGVPVNGELRCDNGKTYVAEHFQRCLRDLEIDVHYCKPFSGEEKPFIERAFHTFSHDLVEHLPGYCGHNVADRKDIESREPFFKRLMKKGETIEMKMTSSEFQVFCDRWCAAYHNQVHSSLGRSPNQALSEWPHPTHQIADERALDVLLAPAAGRNGWRTVTKNGFNIDTFNYISPAFGGCVGKQVRCFMTDDVGRVVCQIENEAGVMEFLCIAECPEITGISRADVTAKGQALQKQVKEQVNALKKRARKEMGGKSTAEVILACREEKAAASNVAHFPRPTVEYSTPALAASAEAGRVLDGKPAPSAKLSPEIIEARERLKAELAGNSGKVARIEVESDKQRYKRWKGLKERLALGEIISEDEYRFYQGFGQSAICRAFADLDETRPAMTQ